jgi:CRP/FNR family cyclic AMP-dependent transcriptional regulator
VASSREVDLRHLWLFSGLSLAEQRAVLRAGRVVEHPARAIVYGEGAPGDEMAVILEGTAAVRRNGRTVARLGVGDAVGELAVLDGQPRSASVVSTAPLRLLVLDRREVEGLLDRSPGLALKLLAALAGRIREADRRAFG